MVTLWFDQVNIVVADVEATTRFLSALGAEVNEPVDGWTDWAPHHIELPTVADGFSADLDSTAFARHWGNLPDGFTGVVVNLRCPDRDGVDDAFERALSLGADSLRPPHDAFWGARFAVVQAPGPIVVGIMSARESAFRGAPPKLSDFT